MREKMQASKLTKEILQAGPGVSTETPDEMALRVCRELGITAGKKREIIVLTMKRTIAGGSQT
ncbi:MAG: hypothetical protein R2853_11150 [Thermomicrobiales bacterium]